MARNLPNILAVDPRNCGCNECSFNEYIPEQEWFKQAGVEDVVALLNGEIGNNTYSEDSYSLVVESIGYYDDYEVKDFIQRIRDQIIKDFALLDFEGLANG